MSLLPKRGIGFVEEMSGEVNGGSSSSLREVQDSEIDFGTDRALYIWGPIFFGMMSNPRRRRWSGRTEFGVDNDEINVAVDGNDSNVDNRGLHRHRQHDRGIDLDREFDCIIRRRRRSSAEILQLLHQKITCWAKIDAFVGSGLDQLLEHLTDNDRIRHGTLPARKKAVENLLTVKICEPLQCSICLDDFDKGSEAKEMCKHKFHVKCIVPWLELHSSCPVCRYKLPPDDEVRIDLVRPITTSLGIRNRTISAPFLLDHYSPTRSTYPNC